MLRTSWVTTAALCLGIIAVAHASTVPSSEFPCSFSTTWHGKSVNWDLSGLHNPSTDYIGYDNIAHTYAFQVCGGLAVQTCKPVGWSPLNHRGFAIELWGDKPSQAGFTKDCVTIAIPPIVEASVLEEDGQFGGVTLQYSGADANTPSDPFWCVGPGAKHGPNRTLVMNIVCAPTQSVPLANIVARQDNCSYIINATSPLACGALNCYHGSMQAGKCVCEEHWSGPKCDKFTGNCAVGSSCSVCKPCCAGYSSGVCEACFEHECKPPVALPPAAQRARRAV